jgi:nucleotide-binding universal stress UspA family protein
MALLQRLARRAPRVLRGYRRLLVPVVDSPESERAIELACRLAADRDAVLVAVAVIEVPALLPLDAYMLDEESAARVLLERAGVTADSYGVGFSPRIVRAREAADEIVEQARVEDVELLVLGAPQSSSTSSGAARFGSTVRRIFESAPCRVMLVAPEAARLRARDARAA